MYLGFGQRQVCTGTDYLSITLGTVILVEIEAAFDRAPGSCYQGTNSSNTRDLILSV
jgi:hypothetical protein